MAINISDPSFQSKNPFGLSGSAFNSPTSSKLGTPAPEQRRAPLTPDAPQIETSPAQDAVPTQQAPRQRLFNPINIGVPESPVQEERGFQLDPAPLRPDQQFIQQRQQELAEPNRITEAVFQQLDGRKPGRYRLLNADEYAAWHKEWKDNQPSWVQDTFFTLPVGGAIEGTGNVVRGLGEAVRALEDVTTTPLINAVFGTNFQSVNLLEAPADAVATYGQKMKSGISVATKEALAKSSPGGDFLDPTTWTLGEDPSLLGYFALTMDVFGQMAPIIAASVVGGGVGGAIAGGAQGGGAAADEARALIDKMAETPGLLEKESAYYRELISRGLNHEEAWMRTREAAAKAAFNLTAPVSGLGGAATAKLINPATKILAGRNLALQIAGRTGLSAAEEGTQEAVESMATQLGINVGAGANTDITDGTFGDFILGALAGGATGSGAGVNESIQDVRANKITDPKGAIGRAVQHGDEQTPDAPITPEPVKDEKRAFKPDAQEQVARAQEAEAITEGLRQSTTFAEGAPVIVNHPDMGTFEATIDSIEPEGAIVFDSDGTVHLVDMDMVAPREATLREGFNDVVAPDAIDDAIARTQPQEALDAAPEPVQAEFPEIRKPAPVPAGPTVSEQFAATEAQTPKVEAVNETDRRFGDRTVSFPDKAHADLYDLGDKVRKARYNSKMEISRVKDLLKDDIAQIADALDITPDDAMKLADDYRIRTDNASKSREGDFTMPIAGTTRVKEMQRAKKSAEKKAEKETLEQQKLATPKTDIDAAAQEAATSPLNDAPEPTPAQKEAGNYKKGHVNLAGLDISIENPKGSQRKGQDRDGKEWSVTMKSHYGYFKGTEGPDKDHIDTFIKDGTESLDDNAPVFVVDQVNKDGSFDEPKVMLGYKTKGQATKAYNANYEKGWTGLGDITQTTMGDLKAWFKDGDTKKPFARDEAKPKTKSQVGGDFDKDGNLTEEKPANKVDPATKKKTASWVIKRKSDGAVIMETSDQKKIDALNTEKFEAVPIGEHLASLNKKKDAEPEAKAEPVPAQKEQVKTEAKDSPAPKKAKTIGGYKKQKLVVPNKLYGDKEIDVWAKDGLGVGKLGKEWTIYHTASGKDLGRSSNRPTRKEAQDLLEKYLTLDIDWTMKPGDAKFDESIRNIAPLVAQLAAGVEPEAKTEKPLARAKGPARGEQQLYVVHNISAEGVKWANELGGLASPSIAIAGADTGYDNFGEISLIGAPEMAAPDKTTRVFNADVYSPRQPRAEFDIKGPAFKRMMDKLDGAAAALGVSIQGSIYPEKVSREGLDAVAREDVTRMAYLMEQGKAPKVKYKKKQPLPAVFKKWTKSNNYNGLYENQDFNADALEYVKGQIEKINSDFAKERAQSRWIVEEDGKELVSYSKIDEILNIMRESQRPPQVDGYETGKLLRNRTQNAKGANKPEYTKWIEDNFGEVLHAKFFTDANQRRKPYELNALVRDMTRTIRDGEGFNYGVGSIRSTVAKQFKSLDQIKGDRGQVVDEKTMEAMKEEVNKEFSDLADEFAPLHSSGQDFGWHDIFSEFLKDLANGNLREWQNSIFKEQASPELVAKARTFLNKLTDLPTEYFEIKMQRAVDLGEFHTALVPNGTPKETVDTLRAKGLKIVRYTKDAEGKGRKEALDKVSSDVFFRAGIGTEPTNQNLVDMLKIVQEVGGLQEPEILDTILIDEAPGWDMEGPAQAAGLYYPISDVIVLAADVGDNRTAYHESFHRLQNLYLTKGEKRALKADAPRLRRIVRSDPELAPLVKNMSQNELEAEAFAIYADKGTTVRPLKSIGGVWDRIADVIDKIKAYIKGENINATSDLFEAAKRGDVAKRKAGQPSLKADEKPLTRPITDKLPKNITSENLVKETIAQLKGKWTDLSPSILNLIPLNYFEELAQPNMTAMKDYMRHKMAMDTFRGDQHAKADEVAQKWLKYVTSAGGYLKTGEDKARAEHLSDLMHESTLAGVDPSSGAKEHVENPKYKALRAKYDAMSPSGKALFKEVRDTYKDQSKLLDSIILDNIKKTQEIAQRRAIRDHEHAREKLARKIEAVTKKGDKERLPELNQQMDELLERFKKDYAKAKSTGAARLIKMRKMFEKTKAGDPYFPLARTGDYFVTVRNDEGDVISFSRREKVVDRDKLAQQMRDAFPDATVETGVLESGNADTRDAMDPRIVGDIQKILGDAGVDEQVQDMIWQRYLESMPDLSTRKRFIHRKGTAGFDADALKAFSKHMFHASHQMARLKYGMELQEATNELMDQAKVSDDPTKGVRLANQLKKNHQWVMNPTGNAFAQKMNSIAFVWFLGVTPAAALVNLTQTPMMGIPIIGARYGFDKAAKAMLKASKDSVMGKGSVGDSPHLTTSEKRAMEAFYRSGLIDKTQAHDLAGVGDTGVEYNPLIAKSMEKIGFFFHRAEVWNREVTALAAYRAAVESGLSHKDAIESAHDLTWKSHFDYSNSSRPSILQNDFAKVALVFRAHSINMIYRVVRDIHQSFKGDTPEARRIARRQLIGIFGMLQLMAGTTGLFGFNQAMWILGMIFGDDDDPLDFEMRMKKDLIDVLGPQWGGIILNGVPGHYTKTDLTSRIGMADIWFRSANRDMEGRDQWQDWILQGAGASVSMVGNWFAAADYFVKGQFADGIEMAAPKVVRDAMRGYRRVSDGVISAYSGNQIIAPEDISLYENLVQGMGFSPASVSETWERNSALRKAESKVMRVRSRLLNKYALAFSMRDNEAMKETIEEIKKFNKGAAHKGLRITGSTIKKSLKAHARNAKKREDGVIIQNAILNKRLRDHLPTRIHQ